FYDQAPPPASLNADRQQAGPRSPLIIVSPYARPGFVDTTATTFAGILAYTEHNFGLSPLATNDAAAYDFANAFNYAQAPRPPGRARRVRDGGQRLRRLVLLMITVERLAGRASPAGP